MRTGSYHVVALAGRVRLRNGAEQASQATGIGLFGNAAGRGGYARRMLYFVDESGIDLKKAPCVVLAGVSIREAAVWPLTQAFMDLSAEILRFPPEMSYEIKGSKLLKKRVFRHASLMEQLPAEQRSAAVEALLRKNEEGCDVGREELAALAQAKLLFVERALGLAADFGMTVSASIVPRDAYRQLGIAARQNARAGPA
jgi:hypothetical protein